MSKEIDELVKKQEQEQAKVKKAIDDAIWLWELALYYPNGLEPVLVSLDAIYGDEDQE